MHKTLQIPMFFEGGKKTCELQHVLAGNAGIYTLFAMSRKRGRRETL